MNKNTTQRALAIQRHKDRRPLSEVMGVGASWSPPRYKRFFQRVDIHDGVLKHCPHRHKNPMKARTCEADLDLWVEIHPIGESQ